MEEGYSTNKSPMFRSVKYDYWKEWMVTHFESIYIDLWDVVENENHIPYDDELNEIQRSQWMIEQKLVFMINLKAQNIMLYALLEEEFTNIHIFRIAK